MLEVPPRPAVAPAPVTAPVVAPADDDEIVTMTIYVSRRDKKKMQRFAIDLGISVSELVRRMIAGVRSP